MFRCLAERVLLITEYQGESAVANAFSKAVRVSVQKRSFFVDGNPVDADLENVSFRMELANICFFIKMCKEHADENGPYAALYPGASKGLKRLICKLTAICTLVIQSPRSVIWASLLNTTL